MDTLLSYASKALQAARFVVSGVERSWGTCGSAIERVVEDLFDGEVLVEAHTIWTRDHYELTIHRLRIAQTAIHATGDGQRCPAVLAHGLVECSVVWLAQGKQSLAARLLREGYDVWLTNTRGNAYSAGAWGVWGNRAHGWSLREIAEEDFPLTLRYVCETTSISKILVVGQSQGAAQALLGLDLQPALNASVAALVLLSPPICLQRPPNKLLESAISNLPSIFYRFVWAITPFAQRYLPDFLTVRAGVILMQKFSWLCHPLDPAAAPLFFRNVPSGSMSDGLLRFWVDMTIHQKHLECDLKRVSCPTFCYFGAKDGIVDMDSTCKKLQDLPSLQMLVVEPTYAHVDFVWTTHAPLHLYNKLLQALEPFTSL
eukprot:TRINITY_DN64421_c0_g1_i1.p1 TRINITY_DN64421_c0_g1~~TRINITY_DN64421_c0_g1_i1.p1  ORF type:complete len:372 (+),score=41.67 TRINITY_DN64421_c0_g1_i1:50-1165(+)